MTEAICSRCKKEPTRRGQPLVPEPATSKKKPRKGRRRLTASEAAYREAVEAVAESLPDDEAPVRKRMRIGEHFKRPKKMEPVTAWAAVWGHGMHGDRLNGKLAKEFGGRCYLVSEDRAEIELWAPDPSRIVRVRIEEI